MSRLLPRTCTICFEAREKLLMTCFKIQIKQTKKNKTPIQIYKYKILLCLVLCWVYSPLYHPSGRSFCCKTGSQRLEMPHSSSESAYLQYLVCCGSRPCSLASYLHDTNYAATLRKLTGARKGQALYTAGRGQRGRLRPQLPFAPGVSIHKGTDSLVDQNSNTFLNRNSPNYWR